MDRSGIGVQMNRSSAEIAVGMGTPGFLSAEEVIGYVRYVDSPESVLDVIDGPMVDTTILFCDRGTLANVVLAAAAPFAGIVTCSAKADARQLVARCRVLGMPCVVEADFSTSSPHGRRPADGTRVRIDARTLDAVIYYAE